MNRSHAMNVIGLMAARRNACAKAGEDIAHGDPAHVARRDVTALRMAEHLFSIATAEQILEAEVRAKQRNHEDAARARAKRRTA